MILISLLFFSVTKTSAPKNFNILSFPFSTMINQNIILHQRVSILVFIALNLFGESIFVFNLCGESIEMQSSILLNFPFF